MSKKSSNLKYVAKSRSVAKARTSVLPAKPIADEKKGTNDVPQKEDYKIGAPKGGRKTVRPKKKDQAQKAAEKENEPFTPPSSDCSVAEEKESPTTSSSQSKAKNGREERIAKFKLPLPKFWAEHTNLPHCECTEFDCINHAGSGTDPTTMLTAQDRSMALLSTVNVGFNTDYFELSKNFYYNMYHLCSTLLINSQNSIEFFHFMADPENHYISYCCIRTYANVICTDPIYSANRRPQQINRPFLRFLHRARLHHVVSTYEEVAGILGQGLCSEALHYLNMAKSASLCVSSLVPDEEIATAKSYGIPITKSDNGMVLHIHMVDRMIRQYHEGLFINYLLRLLLKERHSGLILFHDMYGASRTRLNIKRINKELDGRAYIHYTVTTAILDVTDLKLETKQDDVSTEIDNPVDIIYFCDVYQHGKQHLTKEVFDSYCKLATWVGWNGFCHFGHAGKQGHAGVWWRDNDNLINVIADDKGTTYVHPDVNWIINDPARNWDVQYDSRTDRLQVIFGKQFTNCSKHINVEKPKIHVDVVVIRDDIEFYERAIKQESWLRNFFKLEAKKVLCDMSVLQELIKDSGGKQLTEYNVNVAHSKLSSALSSAFYYPLLLRYNRSILQQIEQGTQAAFLSTWLTNNEAFFASASSVADKMKTTKKWYEQPFKPQTSTFRQRLLKMLMDKIISRNGIFTLLMLLLGISAKMKINWFTKSKLAVLSIGSLVTYFRDPIKSFFSRNRESMELKVKTGCKVIKCEPSAYKIENITHEKRLILLSQNSVAPHTEYEVKRDVNFKEDLTFLTLPTKRKVRTPFLLDVDFRKTEAPLYHVFGFCSNMLRPAFSASSINVMVGRLLERKSITAYTQAVAWRAHPLKVDIPKTHVALTPDLAEVWASQKKKTVLYKEAIKKIVSDPLLPEDTLLEGSVCSVFPKTDELLPASKNAVRPIFTFGDKLTVQLGPVIEEIQTHIKMCFDGKIPRYIDNYSLVTTNNGDPTKVPIYLFYCSGVNYIDLGEWYYNALNTKGYHIIASGDDSLVVYNTTKEILVFEGDFSRYDTSQQYTTTVDDGPLYVLLNLLQTMDIDRLIIDIIREMYEATVDIVGLNKQRLLRIEQKGAIGLPTGCPMTTLNNTVLNLMLWVRCILYANLEESDKFFKTLGFTLKLKRLTEPLHASFLKGHFVPVVNSPQCHIIWTPTVAQLLKVGHCKRNPKHSTPYAKMTLDEALVAYVVDAANSWSYYVLHPIFEAYCEKAKSLRAITVDIQNPTDYGVRTLPIKVPLEIDWTEYNAVYNMSQADIKEILCCISVLKKNLVIDHPVLENWEMVYS